jgi:Luciferase-like monooxygenase
MMKLRCFPQINCVLPVAMALFLSGCVTSSPYKADTSHPIRTVSISKDVPMPKKMLFSGLSEQMAGMFGGVVGALSTIFREGETFDLPQVLRADLTSELTKNGRVRCQWLGVGGTPASFARAGSLGLPLMVAIIGGEHRRFRPLIDLYRQAGLRAGHSLEQLKVGVHSLGYVAEDFATAVDDFFPGYADSFTKIGKERGWPPTTRAHFNAQLVPTGALLVGDPESVAEKILHVNEALGGISRLSFQMSVAALPHAKMLRAIELIGTTVSPMLRNSLVSSPPRHVLPTRSVRAA